MICRCLPPYGYGIDGAWHRDQLRAQEVQAEIVELLLGQVVAREPELQDRHAGGAVVEDFRRLRARGRLPQQKLRGRRHLRVGGVEAGAGLEEDLDEGQAVIGGRFDVLDVVDQRRQRSFVR